MKLNLTNIRKIKKATYNRLEKDVCSYIIDKWNSYDDKKSIFTDVLYNGCQSRMVSKLFYYSDTTRYYEKFKAEINELLYDAMAGSGCYSLKELFGKKWDEEDPLAYYEYNQNLLAWFGFKETLRIIGMQFEEL